jgi:hypothetical protein
VSVQKGDPLEPVRLISDVSERRSEDDDEEEEHTEDAMQVDDEVKQENGDDQAIQPVVRREKQTHQLVEHSDDELQDLNRDVLNAEITQLEGEWMFFDCRCSDL